jgi:hypothetical protein
VLPLWTLPELGVVTLVQALCQPQVPLGSQVTQARVVNSEPKAPSKRQAPLR